jgi:hypothetical protein
VREAVKIYKSKGTQKSLSEFAESVTSFAPTLTPTNNLMLSVQDSTFNLPLWLSGDSVGKWVAGDNATLSVDSTTSTVDTTTEVYSLDSIFTGKVVTSASSATIGIGNDAPITRGIPVTGGQWYQISYYVRSSSGSATTTDSVNWYDSNGIIISSSTDSGNTAGTTWGTRDYFNAKAPSNAVYAGITVSFSAASSYWIDMFQFAKVTGSSDTAVTYKEPRGITVFLNPSKNNYLSNPSFEVDATSSWTFSYASGTAPSATQVALTTGGVYDGPVGARAQNYKGKFVSSSDSVTTIKSTASVDLGSYYTFSFYARAESDLAATIQVKSDSYDGTVKQKTASVTISSGSWKRYQVSLLLPSSTLAKSTNLEVSIFGSWSGKYLYLDCAQLEQGSVATDYFDGAVAGCSWSGTANQSSSYQYPNRDSKVKRLSNYIKDFLPLNTPYYIDYYSDSVSDTKYFGIS